MATGRGPFTQRRFRPSEDCTRDFKGNKGHIWHVPLYWPDRDTYCHVCGKVRRRVKKRAMSGGKGV